MDTLKVWHEVMTTHNFEKLASLLDDDVIFISPVVHTPQVGAGITLKYLTAAAHILGTDKFKYVREIQDSAGAILEFETEIDGKYINGVDMIKWNEAGQITEFKVMVRPLQAVNTIHAEMGKMLAQAQKSTN